jgi:hypothetical protein
MNEHDYLDELVLYEHGKYDITKYKEWISVWDNWLKGSISYDDQADTEQAKELVAKELVANKTE